MNYNQQLHKIGLSEKESEVYLYLLKTSKDQGNTAFLISKNTKIPRSTVYLTIDSLVEKKLVSSFTKNNVLHYLAENPKVLKSDLEEKHELLTKLIPNLLELREDLFINPSVKSYSGKEGVNTVLEDIYDSPHIKGIRELHTISNPSLIEYYPKKLSKLLEYKKKLNIFTKLITTHDIIINTPDEYKTDSHRETRFLPAGFNIDGTIIIYGDKVAIMGLHKKEVYSVIIESPTISSMFDSLFKCIWLLTGKEESK